MRIKIVTWMALAACVGILAIAWVLTDALRGMVALPLLMALMAGGLLIAREKAAPGASAVAGAVVFAHGVWLLVHGGQGLGLILAYAACALVLLGCGLVLRASGWRPETAVVEI